MDKSAELDRTLNRVMDMLKFAEAKNAILLTFEAGIFYALFTELPEVLSEKPLLALFGLPLYLSMLILLISFVPNLNKNISKKNEKNLQFFGDIASLEYDKYKSNVDKMFNKPDLLFEDLLCQIHHNSKITRKKFQAFKQAICVLFVIPVLLKLSVELHYLIKNKIEKV